MNALWIALLTMGLAASADLPTSRVGQPLVLEEIHIPGGEVRPVARRDRTPPLVVRVLAIKPAEGGFRYDFEVTGLDPGAHDLSTYLEPVVTSEKAIIPAIPLEITTALPDSPPRPHALPPTPLPKLGGYRSTLIALGVVWLAGLVAILLWRRKKAVPPLAAAPPPSLAERLRPLVDAAASGKLSPEERARLDRLVIGHWRQRVPEIGALPPARALAQLRRHPEAAPLLLALEKWLHSPAPPPAGEVAALLRPYSSSAPASS